MIPKDGQHVKCILRTGAIAEGIVEEWYNNVVQLRSLDGESILIIPHPNEDIMLIKILMEKPAPEQVNKEDYEIKNNLEKQFQKVQETPSTDPLRLKKLAELKLLMVEQEKKIIADKVKSHQVGEPRKVQYGQPGFLKKQNPE